MADTMNVMIRKMDKEVWTRVKDRATAEGRGLSTVFKNLCEQYADGYIHWREKTSIRTKPR